MQNNLYNKRITIINRNTPYSYACILAIPSINQLKLAWRAKRTPLDAPKDVRRRQKCALVHEIATRDGVFLSYRKV